MLGEKLIGAHKENDELVIKIKLTKDSDDAVSELMKMMYRHMEICDGVVISAIYLQGKDIETVKNEMKHDVLKALDQEFSQW